MEVGLQGSRDWAPDGRLFESRDLNGGSAQLNEMSCKHTWRT